MPTILISTHAEEDFAELLAASPALAFIPKASCPVRLSGARSDLPDSGTTPPVLPQLRQNLTGPAIAAMFCST